MISDRFDINEFMANHKAERDAHEKKMEEMKLAFKKCIEELNKPWKDLEEDIIRSTFRK